MSEQRNRLLPFRLRRERGRRVAPHLFRADDTPADAELRELLSAWRAPAPDPAARARLLADFRAHAAAARPRWRRLLAARVSVPVPLAAGAAAALVVSALALAALAARGADAPASFAAGAASAVRVVEVPVTHERVVTRTVYVERERREPAAPRVAAAPQRPAPAPEEAEGDDATSYFTGVDMAEFRPADKMEIRVIRKGRPEDEGAKPDDGPERKSR